MKVSNYCTAAAKYLRSQGSGYASVTQPIYLFWTSYYYSSLFWPTAIRKYIYEYSGRFLPHTMMKKCKFSELSADILRYYKCSALNKYIYFFISRIPLYAPSHPEGTSLVIGRCKLTADPIEGR